MRKMYSENQIKKMIEDGVNAILQSGQGQLFIFSGQFEYDGKYWMLQPTLLPFSESKTYYANVISSGGDIQNIEVSWDENDAIDDFILDGQSISSDLDSLEIEVKGVINGEIILLADI